MIELEERVNHARNPLIYRTSDSWLPTKGLTMTTEHDLIRMTHRIDDIERKRTAGVRTMIDCRDLLADALDAIRAGDTHVADEFVDRALDAITKQLASQREGS